MTECAPRRAPRSAGAVPPRARHASPMRGPGMAPTCRHVCTMRTGTAWGTLTPMEEHAPHRKLTYRALAQLWGCSVEAAQERVRRHRWGKEPGNGRQVLVRVPVADLEAAADEPAPDAGAVLADVRAERERQMQALRDRLAEAETARQHANGERDAARREAVEQREARLLAEGEAHGLREAIRIAEEGRRDADERAAEALAQAAQARAQGEAAEAAAAQARTNAEAAQSRLDAFQAMPWWQRLMRRP
jgi:hypothetical protein